MSLIKSLAQLPAGPVANVAGSALLSEAELGAVTKQELDLHLEQVVNKWNLAGVEFDKVKTLFQYEGFDPKEVHTHLLARKKSQNISDADFLEDLALILILQHIKGNITAANIKTLRDDAQQMAVSAINRYALQLAIGKEKRRAVTIPRVAAAYPLQTTLIAVKIPKDFPGYHGTKILPDFMKSSVFAACIPIGTSSARFLLAAYSAYTCDMSLSLKKASYTTMKKDLIKAEYDTAVKFSDVMFNSVLLLEEAKAQLLTQCKIKEHYKNIKKVVEKIVDIDDSIIIDEKEWNTDCNDWASM